MAQVLTLTAAIFLSGAILLLERRCVGRSAFVHPLVLCLLTGIISGQETTCLWLGVSLQLLSVGQHYYCNWALAAIVVSGTVMGLHIFGIHLVAGDPASLAMLCVAILFSIMSEMVEVHLRRGHSAPLHRQPLWTETNSFNAFGKIIHRRILRGFFTGGIESLIGVAVAMVLAMGAFGRIPVHHLVSEIVRIVVPVFGVAVTMGSLSRKRYPVIGLAGVAAAIVISEVL